MIRIINKPHLPQGQVRQVIIGNKYRNLLENALFEHNIEVFWLDDNPCVDERLRGHADLSVLHTGSNKLYCCEYLENSNIVNNLTNLGFEVQYTKNPQKDYPLDAGLNICILNDKLFYNSKSAYSIVIESIKEKEKIQIKQGYTKCSVCVVNENAIITSDRIIHRKATENKIQSLLIEKPFVKLDGFEHGFIGGASFKLNKNKIAFTGRILDNEIRNKIESYLQKLSITPVYLTEHEIFDIGSAVVLTEDI